MSDFIGCTILITVGFGWVLALDWILLGRHGAPPDRGAFNDEDSDDTA